MDKGFRLVPGTDRPGMPAAWAGSDGKAYYRYDVVIPVYRGQDASGRIIVEDRTIDHLWAERDADGAPIITCDHAAALDRHSGECRNMAPEDAVSADATVKRVAIGRTELSILIAGGTVDRDGVTIVLDDPIPGAKVIDVRGNVPGAIKAAIIAWPSAL